MKVATIVIDKYWMCCLYDYMSSFNKIKDLDKSYVISKTVLKGNTLFKLKEKLNKFVSLLILLVCGNCVVMATVISQKRIRTARNILIFNLALSDLMLGNI